MYLFSHSSSNSFSTFTDFARDSSISRNESVVFNGGRGSSLCPRFCGLKLWLLKSLNLRQGNYRAHQPLNEHVKHTVFSDERGLVGETRAADFKPGEKILGSELSDGSYKVGDLSSLSNDLLDVQRGASLYIVLCYSGYFHEDVGIFGFSGKNLTDEDLLSEEADNNGVYRNEVHHFVSEQTQILSDVASGPTLPRTKVVRCAKCQQGEAVFFQTRARGEEGMTLFFVCCNPNFSHRWTE